MKILLVDDEEEFVETLAERLNFRGIETVGLTSGRAALDLLGHDHFDVVVADLKMPSVDGELIRDTVRRQHPGTLVYLMTGHGSQAEKVPAGEEYLVKPFTIDVLLSRIAAAGLETGQEDV